MEESERTNTNHLRNQAIRFYALKIKKYLLTKLKLNELNLPILQV